MSEEPSQPLPPDSTLSPDTTVKGAWKERLSHGSLHGFPTYAEIESIMDQLVQQYPNYLRKIDLGVTVEGRKIPVYRLCGDGDTPCPFNNNDKPQMLITGAHHSCEPASITVTIHFIGTLLDNSYDGMLFERYLIKNRDLWVIPVVNVDGYIANEVLGVTTIRKNRLKTCDDPMNMGVDLNRNYGTRWAHTPTNKCDPLEYPGQFPFSEPETASIRSLVEDRLFKAAVNFHSYGNFWTHPNNWSKDRKLPDDVTDTIYREIGITLSPILFSNIWNIPHMEYTTNGESDDWFLTEHGIISMSPEVGPEKLGFWPPPSEINGINEANYVPTATVLLKSGVELSCRWEWQNKESSNNETHKKDDNNWHHHTGVNDKILKKKKIYDKKLQSQLKLTEEDDFSSSIFTITIVNSGLTDSKPSRIAIAGLFLPPIPKEDYSLDPLIDMTHTHTHTHK
eukprot:GHVR01166771.1.p1 GENE.GHVR01166771.1~~GHVR01166771.1.p1  ORF type:complete len:451 (-),score=93.68 GHVR01166771.1:569-1921(-)